MAEPVGLTPSLLQALREIARPGYFRKTISSDARDRLIELGYIEQKMSGLVATAKGKLYLAGRLERKRKRIWRPEE